MNKEKYANEHFNKKNAAFHRSFLFSTFQPQNVLILFLFFHQFQPRCPYKVCSYKKNKVYARE